MAVAFDTLKLARTLRDTAQMSQTQAEGIADALAEAMSGAELATKTDISGLKVDLTGLKVEAKGDIARLEERVERRAAETEARLIRWVVGTGVASVLAIGGLILGALRSLSH